MDLVRKTDSLSTECAGLRIPLGFPEAPFWEADGKLRFAAGSFVLMLLGFEAQKLQNEAS